LIIIIFEIMRNISTNVFLIGLWITFCLNTCFAQRDLEVMRQLIFEKTNALRLERGLPELIQLDSLMDFAQLHSENMVKHDFYAHVDHLGRNPVKRAEKFKLMAWIRKGNQFTGIAENIAQTPWFENVRGCGDTRTEEDLTQCMVTGWKNSPPHYKNILGDYTHLGIGLYFDDKGTAYGTQNFR
jgi:uncharacterized protein YkwD